MNIPFKKANILIPKNVDMSKWSVVACDQYTSEPSYWNETEKIVGKKPSTLNMILPEVYLEEDNLDNRIKRVNKEMEKSIKEDLYNEYKDTLIYVERTQSDGRIRQGIIGMLDLEDYSYEQGAGTIIRATEKTVIERIPIRVKIREEAVLEIPHIMILIDDDKKEIIENLKDKVTKKDELYDFDLMQHGGHIRGYKLNNNVANKVIEQLEKRLDKKQFEDKYKVKDKPVLLFAIGDGNHSLAAAKTCYDELKKKMTKEEYLNHPSRYALVELVNLHSDALKFESINRVVFDVDQENLIKELNKYYKINDKGIGQKFILITNKEEKELFIENPKSNLSVGSIQLFLDKYLKNNKGKIDYIHGDKTTKELSKKENNVGFIFEPMKKDELFKTVILDGALPRKSFSMGHSEDKRFYLEARKIK